MNKDIELAWSTFIGAVLTGWKITSSRPYFFRDWTTQDLNDELLEIALTLEDKCPGSSTLLFKIT